MTIQFETYSTSSYEQLASLTSEIWRVAYQDILQPEQIDYMLDMMYHQNKIAQQLSEGQQWKLVFVDLVLAGFLHYYEKGSAVMLSKIYVHPKYWGTPLSSHMLSHVEEFTLQKNHTHIELTVNKYNERAQKFYLKKGFKNVAEAVFDIGEGYIMDDYIFQKSL